jgi:hypothetical protein
MHVLFDNGTPRNLARYLIDHHTVTEYRAREWLEFATGAAVCRESLTQEARQCHLICAFRILLDEPLNNKHECQRAERMIWRSPGRFIHFHDNRGYLRYPDCST